MITKKTLPFKNIHRSNHFILLSWLELSENVMAVDKHFQKDIEMLQMT